MENDMLHPLTEDVRPGMGSTEAHILKDRLYSPLSGTKMWTRMPRFSIICKQKLA